MPGFYDNTHSQGGENVVVAHTLHGSPAGGTLQAHGTQDGSVKQATGIVMKHYKPPSRRKPGDMDATLCAAEGCNAYPSKGKDYCTGHAREHGQLPVCSRRDCFGPPKGDTGYCRWHQPAGKVTSDEAE